MEDTVHLKIKVLHRYFNTYKDCKRHLQACTDIHQKTYLGTQTGIRRHTYYRGTGLQMDGTSSTMSGIQITLNDIAKSFQTFFCSGAFSDFLEEQKKISLRIRSCLILKMSHTLYLIWLSLCKVFKVLGISYATK